MQPSTRSIIPSPQAAKLGDAHPGREQQFEHGSPAQGCPGTGRLAQLLVRGFQQPADHPQRQRAGQQQRLPQPEAQSGERVLSQAAFLRQPCGKRPQRSDLALHRARLELLI